MTERWEKMVENERLAATVGVPPTKVLRCDDAVKLLARQHRAFVRMVKKIETLQCYSADERAIYSVVRLSDVLAALAKQGGGNNVLRRM